MDSFELNKVAGAVLGTLLLAMGSGFVAELIYSAKPAGSAGYALPEPQPEAAGGEEEIELGDSEMDVVFYDAAAVDVGEAVAETLLLNLDPYPRAPGAEEALKAAGVKSQEEAGPFAALAGLKDKLKK
jgi:hypothetical protein